LSAQGDLAGALTAYRESLRVSERLASSDPSNATWQRDLSYSFTQQATCHEQQGSRSEALHYAELSLEIDRRLASLDITNVMWQNDLAVSQALVERLKSGASNAK
ncbi:MAG: tetratricopeptide repeat protein, partial [Chlorobium sp.]